MRTCYGMVETKPAAAIVDETLKRKWKIPAGVLALAVISAVWTLRQRELFQH